MSVPTVTLHREAVEKILTDRFQNRLHALSDGDLGALLERLMREDAEMPVDVLAIDRVAQQTKMERNRNTEEENALRLVERKEENARRTKPSYPETTAKETKGAVPQGQPFERDALDQYDKDLTEVDVLAGLKDAEEEKTDETSSFLLEKQTAFEAGIPESNEASASGLQLWFSSFFGRVRNMVKSIQFEIPDEFDPLRTISLRYGRKFWPIIVLVLAGVAVLLRSGKREGPKNDDGKQASEDNVSNQRGSKSTSSTMLHSLQSMFSAPWRQKMNESVVPPKNERDFRSATHADTKGTTVLKNPDVASEMNGLGGRERVLWRKKGGEVGEGYAPYRDLPPGNEGTILWRRREDEDANNDAADEDIDVDNRSESERIVPKRNTFQIVPSVAYPQHSQQLADDLEITQEQYRSSHRPMANVGEAGDLWRMPLEQLKSMDGSKWTQNTPKESSDPRRPVATRTPQEIPPPFAKRKRSVIRDSEAALDNAEPLIFGTNTRNAKTQKGIRMDKR